MSERTDRGTPTDETRRRNRLDDPATRERVREIQDELKHGQIDDPGVDAEELPDFLREQRR